MGFIKYYTDKALGIKRPVYHRPSLMRPIRKAVYRMGLAPKPGSIFFSPSIAFWSNAHQGFVRGVNNVNNDRKAQS